MGAILIDWPILSHPLPSPHLMRRQEGGKSAEQARSGGGHGAPRFAMGAHFFLDLEVNRLPLPASSGRAAPTMEGLLLSRHGATPQQPLHGRTGACRCSFSHSGLSLPLCSFRFCCGRSLMCRFLTRASSWITARWRWSRSNPVSSL